MSTPVDDDFDNAALQEGLGRTLAGSPLDWTRLTGLGASLFGAGQPATVSPASSASAADAAAPAEPGLGGLVVSWTDDSSGNRHTANLGSTPIGGATSWMQGNPYASTYTAAALDRLFPVTGGTDRQRAEVKNDILRIAHTNRGSQLFDKALRGATPYPTEIVDNRTPRSIPGGPAMVNPERAPLEWLRSDHDFKPDIMRQLAHELFGHFIDGVGDTGPGGMDNIRRNENPIMMEIYPEQGDRLKYP